MKANDPHAGLVSGKIGVHKLTVMEKIWAIILEVVAVVTELTAADDEELMMQIIENDR